MDCRQVESQLAMLSADALPYSTAHQMREHLSLCPHCEREWQLLQTTLLVLSTGPQALPTQRQTEQLWQGCAEYIFYRTEARRAQGSPSNYSAASWMNWARNQPRWGWVALGSAVAALGGAWWFSPQDNQPELLASTGPALVESASERSLLPPPDANAAFPGRLITFQRLPALASSMVDSHTTMTFAPFVDHVGMLVVSSSAADSEANASYAPGTVAGGTVARANDAALAGPVIRR